MDPKLKEFKNIFENNQEYFFEAQKRIIDAQLKYSRIKSRLNWKLYCNRSISDHNLINQKIQQIEDRLNPTHKYLTLVRLKHLQNSKPGDRFYLEPIALKINI